LNVDIKHIGERTMTKSQSNRALAVAMAVAAMATFWIPTLSGPAEAAPANPVHITIITGSTQPVMM
jgi:hypothetical protein